MAPRSGEVTILQDEPEALWAVENRPDLLDGRVVYCAFPNAVLRLAGLGRPADILAELIQDDESESLWNRAYAAASEWYAPFRNDLMFQGVDLGHCVKLWVYLFFLEAVAADMALERLLKDRSPTIVRFLRPEPIDRPGLATMSHSVLERTLRSLCAQRGIPLRIVRAYSPSRARAVRAFLRAPLKRIPGLLHLTGWVRERRAYSKVNEDNSILNRKWRPSARRVVGFGEEYDSAIIGAYIRALTGHQEFDAVLATNTAALNTPRSGLLFDPSVPRASVRFLLAPHGAAADVPRAPVRFLATPYGGGPCEVISRNTLKPCFDGVWHTLPSLREAIRQGLNFFDTVKPHALAFTDLGNPTVRAMVQLARERKILSIAVPHGWIFSPEGFEFSGDLFCAWGEVSRSLMRPYCRPETKRAVIPDLTLSKLGRDGRDGHRPVPSAETGKTVLLLCTGFHPSVLTDFKPKAFFSTWSTLIEFGKSRPELRFIIRTHPVKNYNAWAIDQLERGGARNFATSTTGKLEEVLPQADLVVDFGKPGTGTILAMLFNKPVILCKHISKYKRGANAHIFGLPGISCVGSPEELVSVIESKLAGSSDLHDQDRALKMVFDMDVDSEQAFPRLLRELLKQRS